MKEDFENFERRFKERLHTLFYNEGNINSLSLERGLPGNIWEGIMETIPLSVAIPEKFGGRGLSVKECLSVLSAASYESLPLSLTFGINIALFLEPLAKYGHPKIQERIFKRFLKEKAMGGLMITEPDYGSDALNMRTSFNSREDGFAINGKKHWQGLTGMADFWIVAAREQLKDGDLGRDIAFFITEQSSPGQQIEVEYYFNNLGLYMIPYGMNAIDIFVPENQKLQSESTGIKMMLDILHRSRMQFPGMGLGFIRRMLDEALAYCNQRKVAGQSLFFLDSVKYQLSRIESSYAICSGMCARSAVISSINADLSSCGLEANIMKALVTDLMQESSQIALQLQGSSGYKIDNIAGRGIVDSRPFQIFEGSNEMLYTQIAEIMIKKMKKMQQETFFQFLSGFPLTEKIAGQFKELLDFSIKDTLLQRQLITLGKIIARVVSLQYVYNMTLKGFRNDLYDNCCKHMMMDIKSLLSNLTDFNNSMPVEDYTSQSAWSDFI
ncbi:acyl-CoA dehydrogenase family protein [Flavobacterium sp. RNTU_13]|uniref:acyl-CoA dehydrogenase family protein n=1 Tax=Flavobacterium sp. RNTU_13 TaxID=3375145 RepID=UPI003988906B